MKPIQEEILCHLIILEHPGLLDYQIINQFAECQEWSKDKGPVICCCNLEGAEYLVRNQLDMQLYIDMIVTNMDVTIEQVEKAIGEGAKIHVINPFDIEPMTEEEKDSKMDMLNDKYQNLCKQTIDKEALLYRI